MLSAEDVRHTYGSVRALDGISFRLEPGHTLAVFGPNGAGKTTLLRVLAGLIRPHAGRAHVDGGARAIGWIGHQSHLYAHLTVRENLIFWASLYGVPGPERGARADDLMRRLDLADRAAQPVATLSRGLLQRAAIARALVHEPAVLLLDEPFTGLDLAAAAEFRRLLAELARGGRAVVIATHNVEEGVELATEIAFQHRGRFVELAPRRGRGAAEIADAYRRAVSGG
jgi:heme ABC exporter ATP-binding subunit CcmA